jgi:L-alanine-DL-glutamate epimerase-like enolase superfamily enzyme
MAITGLRFFRVDYLLPHKKPNSRNVFMRGTIVRIENEEKMVGYGSAYHPIPDEKIENTIKYLILIKDKLNGLEVIDIESIHKVMDEVIPVELNAPKAAVDIACHDILGKMKNLPVYKLLGVKKPYVTPTIISLYLKDVEKMKEDALSLLEKYGKNRLNRFKVHLSGDVSLDFYRVNLILDVFDGDITLGPSGAFKDPKKAVEFLNRLYKNFGDRILLVSEPCPKFEDNVYVTQKSKIPVYLLVKIKTLNDLEEVIQLNAANGIFIHPYRMGGLFKSKKFAEAAIENDLNIIVGCGGNCGITISAGAHLASVFRDVVTTDLSDDLLYPELRLVKDETMPDFRNGARIPLSTPGLGIQMKDWVNNVFNNKILLKEIT